MKNVVTLELFSLDDMPQPCGRVERVFAQRQRLWRHTAPVDSLFFWFPADHGAPQGGRGQ